MNTKLLTLLLLLCCAPAFSQDYIPFLSNTSWKLDVSGQLGTQERSIVPSANVMIDGNTYVPYNNVPLAGNMLIREDVAARRVYRRVDNADELLYDFSLEVNDMVEMPGGVTYTVTSRDSMWSMTGRKRVRINLAGYSSNGGPINDSWIEGVGTWSHPFKHYYELPSDPATMIKCSFTDGEQSYNRGLANTGGVTPTPCELPTAGIDKNIFTAITLYPNPAADVLNISNTTGREIRDVSVYSINGVLVKQANNGNALNIAELQNGMYFIKIQVDSQVVNYKFMKK